MLGDQADENNQHTFHSFVGLHLFFQSTRTVAETKQMTSSANLMLQREFISLKRTCQSTDYVIHEMVLNNCREWIVFLFGAPHTMFEGGTFKCLMRFNEDYPISPPSLQFLSHIFHPNVYRDGKVCITTLQSPSPNASKEETMLNWNPVLGVHGALESVVSLLNDPNPFDPANSESAHVFVHDLKEFTRLARMASSDSQLDWPEEGLLKPVLISPSHKKTGVVVTAQQQQQQPLLLDNTLGPQEEYEYSDEDFGQEEEDE
jgi:ubiquitin-protein ligase